MKLLGAPDDVWNARADAEDDAWQGNAWWRADADYKTVAAASCLQPRAAARRHSPPGGRWHAHAACAAYEAAMAAARRQASGRAPSSQ